MTHYFDIRGRMDVAKGATKLEEPEVQAAKEEALTKEQPVESECDRGSEPPAQSEKGLRAHWLPDKLLELG
ncbi:MAG: hypothetical protein C5B47_03380 [Verrucomicrobia bacterium]|nr:MAG: hypothetical protein C5B47_03380 [Verrucomicrobiota bacterium]